MAIVADGAVGRCFTGASAFELEDSRLVRLIAAFEADHSRRDRSCSSRRLSR